MDTKSITEQIIDTIPFKFVELDQTCDQRNCDNKLTGVKYPDKEPRLMDHHDERYETGKMEYYPVKLRMCTPCLLKDNEKKVNRRTHYGSVKMIDYDNKMKEGKL